MKSQFPILLLSIFLIVLSNTSGQNSGVIIFEQKSKLNININSDNQEMLNNLPKEHISIKELIFDSTASLFHEHKKQDSEEVIESEAGEGKMILKMNSPDDRIYCDLLGKKKIEQREFMSRKFLIEIPFNSSTWKITGNQKNILNYSCQEAILQDTSRNVKVWFTSSIPLSTGPYGACNLPGMVLGAEYKGGEVSFEAKSVEFKKIDHKLITRPTDGKKVSREEFNKMVIEKNKEMEESGEGNGGIIFHIKK